MCAQGLSVPPTLTFVCIGIKMLSVLLGERFGGPLLKGHSLCTLKSKFHSIQDTGLQLETADKEERRKKRETHPMQRAKLTN